MMNKTPELYIPYMRVSDIKQATDGDGLESQKHRCLEAIKARGGIVAECFHDIETGGGNYQRRSGIMAMLAYIDSNPKKRFTVIFDDTKRFSRDTEFFLKLVRELRERNANIECLNLEMDDSPESEFIMTMIAATGTLERKQNRRQVIQKQTARIQQGHWTFQAPTGYFYTKSKHGGKGMVRDEPLASFIADVLNRYAVGALQTQAEVRRELENHPHFPKYNGKVYPTRVRRLLTQPIYAGYVQMPKWNIPLCKGSHEPLIDWETYQKIQNRLKGNSHAPARKNINEDFALRGFLECSECGRPLTSCHSKSKTGKLHPYYRCYYKPCSAHGKSLPRDKVESEFGELLTDLTPTTPLFKAAQAMFKAGWQARSLQSKELHQDLKIALKQKDKEIAKYVDRLIETDNASVIRGLESKIEQLETSKLLIAAKLEKTRKPQRSFEDMFELACEFLSNPYKLWEKGNLALRRTVLKLVFTERVVYDRKEGFLNPKKAFPFKMLDSFDIENFKMVVGVGFEPT